MWLQLLQGQTVLRLRRAVALRQDLRGVSRVGLKRSCDAFWLFRGIVLLRSNLFMPFKTQRMTRVTQVQGRGQLFL
jgi:hypothetical protein